MLTLLGCNYFGPCLDGSGPAISEQRTIEDFTGVVNAGSFEVFVTRDENFSVEVIAQENLIPIIETYVSGNTLVIKTENDACYRSGLPVEVHITMPETELLRLTGSGKVFADLVANTEVEISNSGSGTMEIDAVEAGTYLLSNSGSGYIGVDGAEVREADLIQSGSGEIQCGMLTGTLEVDIRHSSSGRISARIEDGVLMDAVLSGSGHIELTGGVETAEYSLNSSGRVDGLELEASDVKAINTGSGDIFLWARDLLDVTITGSGDIIYRGDPVISSRITGSGNIRSY
jgi:hypothetical protein